MRRAISCVTWLPKSTMRMDWVGWTVIGGRIERASGVVKFMRVARNTARGVDALVTASNPIFTIGHSTRSIVEFVELLRAGQADFIVDVRTVPRSRRNPQYNESVLPEELARHQVGYVRIPGLGGLRGRSREVPREINAFWENDSFHNYADYALSPRLRRSAR